MKKIKIINYILIFTPLLLSLFIINISFLPTKIPMHFNNNGIVNRYGSINELLILPLFILGVGIILETIIMKYKKKDVSLYLSLTMIYLYLNALVLSNFIITHLLVSNQIARYPININYIFLGFLLIGFSCVIRRSKRNSFFGLRTTWSLRNDYNWNTCQKITGNYLLVSGIMIALVSIIINSSFVIFINILILLLMMGLSSFHSFKKCKGYEKQ